MRKGSHSSMFGVVTLAQSTTVDAATTLVALFL